jgi:hypothetical protein
VVNPDVGIESLRNLMVPENMKASQALRDFFLSKAEAGVTADPAQTMADWTQTLALLVSSHLEVVNVLGAMEHNGKVLKEQLGNLADGPTGRHAAPPN